MKRSMSLILGILLISLMASPALSQGSGDMNSEQTQTQTQQMTKLQTQTQLQLQKKNHNEMEPNHDGNGGINRNMSRGESGPHGDDYTHHVDSEPVDALIPVLQAVLDRWLFLF